MQRVFAVGPRCWCWLLVLALFALAPASARAEELNSQGNLVFSAERLFGFYFDHLSIDTVTRASGVSDTTAISLGLASPVTPLMVPRLGIDYFLGRNFTLGGNIGFYSISRENSSTTGFLLGLRAGYALRLGHAVSLWPRAGFTYTTSTGDNNVFALTVDAPFTFALTEGFAFTLGPTLDLGFLGERGGLDATEIIFGVMFGLTGWTNL